MNQYMILQISQKSKSLILNRNIMSTYYFQNYCCTFETQKAVCCCAENSSKIRGCQQLCANEIKLVDLNKCGLKPRAPTKSVRIRAFISIRKTELNRAKIDFERRFMNNVNDKTFQEL